MSESERSAAAIGLSPNRIALLNWALGSAIAAVAGILVVPIITLQVTAMTALILAALAAALVGDFRSFPIATAAGFALGIGQALVGRFADQQGLGPSLPFLVIIVVLVFRGRSLPLRDHYLQQLPMLGNGRISWAWALFGCGAVVFVMLTKQTKWIDAITVSLGVAIVLLSIVVLTGYAGQLSLAQYSIAGFGAYVAGRLVAVFDIPFLLGLVAGVAAAVPLGLIFGLPAVRTRGINLAIVTLGLGTTIELMLFKNRNYTGGVQGTQVGNPDLFGYDIGSINHPARYGIFVLVMAMLAVVVVANVRRGRSGRRLIAVRTNERAAAALGIDVMVAKLFAFSLASAIAALGGIVLAFRLSSISYQSFTNFTSITYVGLALVGGVGQLLGAFVGSHHGHGGDQPGDPRVDVGGRRTVDPADQRHRDPAHGVGVQGRRGRRVGQDLPLHQEGEEVEPAVHHRARRRRRSRGRHRPPRTSPAADPDLGGSDGALRGGRRRPRRELPARTGHRHRPDRTERRRQDVADRRHQWIHAGRGSGAARRRRPVEGAAGQARPGRCGPVVPVARAVRGLDGVREPQRGRRPAGSPLVRARPDLADQPAVPTRSRAGRSRSSSSTRTSTAMSRTCPTGSGGCWPSPGRWRCIRACSCSTSRRPA